MRAVTSDKPNPAPPNTIAEATALLRETLTRLVSDEPALKEALSNPPPVNAKAWLDKLAEKPDGRRDAALTMLAIPVALNKKTDITDRIQGDRTVSNTLGEILAELKIPGVRSALQNSSFRHGFVHERIRGSEGASLHRWASEEGTSIDEVRRAFFYLAALLAETARDIPEMAKVDKFALSFDRCVYVIDELLKVKSNGAYPQFLFAGWLQALIESRETNQRVVTKGLYSSDRSAGTAGDVQVIKGQARVVDAFEVADRSWRDKIDQAVAALNTHGINQVTIVAPGKPPSAAELLGALEGKTLRPSTEVVVLDLRSELISMVRQVSTPVLRLRALEHAYHFLSEESDPQLLKDFNRVLNQAGLTP